MKGKLVLLCSALLLGGALIHAAPLGTAFIYQGRLDQNGQPANGTYQMLVELRTEPVGGTLLRTNLYTIAVSNGLFAVDMDFGSLVFLGEERWLDLRVSTNGANQFITLTPRTRIAPTPNAIYASTAGTVAYGAIQLSQLGTVGSAPGPGQVLGYDGSSLVWQPIAGISNVWTLSGSNAYYNGGNVGIGTATPLAPLHVNSTATGSKILAELLQPNLVSGGFNQIYLGRSGIGNGCGTFTYNYDGANPASSFLSLGLYNSSFTLNLRGNGNVGIGTTSPQARLDVNGPILSGQGNTLNGALAVIGGGQNNSASGDSSVVSGGVNNSAEGTLSIVAGGRDNFAKGAHSFAAGALARALHDNSFVWADYQEDPVFPFPTPFESTTTNQFSVRAAGGVRFETRFLRVSGSGNEQAYLGGDGVGNDIQVGSLNPAVTDIYMFNAGNSTHMHTHVGVLTIHGGSDLAEPFPIKEEEIEKGSVVIIDDEYPGQLKRSTRAYDTRVAGIVSGANGIKPGISLKQEGALDQGENVALTGRVYVKADASFGTIKPGDLLTTSDTPGHAMKVIDHSLAQGAILGKAMSALADGKGLVLVLVTLQ